MAQARKRSQPVQGYRVDRKQPMFDLPVPSIGGGAIDPASGVLALALGALGLAAFRKESGKRSA